MPDLAHNRIQDLGGGEGSNVSHDAHIHAPDEFIQRGHVTAGAGSQNESRSQTRHGPGLRVILAELAATHRSKVHFLFIRLIA